jgi:hypothetical protein
MPYIQAVLQEPRALRRRTGRFNFLTRPTVRGGYSRQHRKRLQHKCLRFEQCCVIGLTVCRFDILPSLKGEDSLQRLACVLRVRFDGFLLHRGAVLRSVSTGFTSGLSFPRRVSRLARRVVNRDNCKINSNRLPQPKC